MLTVKLRVKGRDKRIFYFGLQVDSTCNFPRKLNCDNKEDSQGKEFARSKLVVMPQHGQSARCISRRQSPGSASCEIKVALPVQQRRRKAAYSLTAVGTFSWSVSYEKLENAPFCSPGLSIRLHVTIREALNEI
jgi:hypothetical protein